MDHIKLPQDRDPFEFTVRLFAIDTHKYDGQGFEGFPARKGFDLTTLQHHKSPTEVLSLVQAWLYFGVLAEVFDKSFQQEDFLRSDHTSTALRIYTGLLPMYIARRSTLVRKVFSSGKRAIHVLQMAHDACNRLDRHLEHGGAEWATLLLSIRVLFESLAPVFRIDLEVKIQPAQPSISPVKEHLAKRVGWCLHRIDLIDNCASYLTALYLANVRRHLQPWISHENCWTQDKCIAYDVDQRTFESRHTAEDCFCKHIGPPKEDMLRILKEGGIPIVRCAFGQDDTIELSYSRASPGAQYAAISHLWADGLANQIDNTLPHCQVQRIAQNVAEASRLNNARLRLLSRFKTYSVYFWLDTFCVPIVKQNEDGSPDLGSSQCEMSNMKQMALERMFATYSWAQFVLVVDSELACLDESADETELWARVNLCGWNTRCWTSVEYCSSQTTLFQCKKSRRPRFVWNYGNEVVLRELSKMMTQLSIAANAKNKCSIFVGANAADRSGYPGFSAAWNLLATRNTTKREDVPRIFANLMGVYVSSAASLRPHDLMKSVVAKQDDLPLPILFIETERYDRNASNNKQTLSRDIWVPVAPHNSEKLALPFNDEDLVDLGLLPPYRAPYLNVIDHGLRFSEHFYGSQWKMYELQISQIDDFCFRAGESTFRILLREPKPRPLPHHMYRIYVVLDLSDESVPCYDTKPSARRKGCLLLRTSEDRKMVRMTYLCPVYCGTCAESASSGVAPSSTMVAEIVDVAAKQIIIASDISTWCKRANGYHDFTPRLGFAIATFVAWLVHVALFAIANQYIKPERSLTGDGMRFGTVISLTIALWAFWCMKYKVMYYIHISQYLPSSEKNQSWAEKMEMVLPKDRQAVGWYRFYIVCSIIRVLLLGRSCWRKLVRSRTRHCTPQKSKELGSES